MKSKLTPKQRLALIVFCRYRCEICEKLGKGKRLNPEELEIHRIKNGVEGGTYNHRNLMVLCLEHHNILSSALRKSIGVTS